MLFCALLIQAQNISVSSFRLLETDLTANNAETIVRDQNGEVAALIKVVTTQTGFSFDVGQLGVVKTVQMPAEIWVYVPRGIKKISISHPQLGILRDYYLNISIEAARTYEMVLVSGTVETTIHQARTSQYVVFQLTPPNAVVELNGELLETVDGTATKMMKFGTYNYRVQAPNYYPDAGNVTVNDPNNKHIVHVALKPNFSAVTLKVEGDAEIWVNGERKGIGTWTGNLGAGTYVFEAKKANHRDSYSSRDIVVTEEPQVITLQTPTPILGEADINSYPAMADIYIDGQKIGQTPQLVSNLLEGQHQLRITKQGFKEYSTTLTVRERETSSISAKLEKAVIEQAAVKTSESTSNTAIPTITVGNVSFNMIRIDGGTFMMGATNEQQNPNPNEEPVHQVTLSSFYMGETEVTQALWETVMGKNPSNFKGAERPVEMVSWKECQSFIKKLNKKTGLSFRLPTEAEWEYAARGAGKSKGYQYSGSDYIDIVAWYDRNSDGRTHDVKTKQANELGLYDMSGNVGEWCQDWKDDYPTAAQNDPMGPSSGSLRIVRGGDWRDFDSMCRVAFRNFYFKPDEKSNIIGLRLVLQSIIDK